MPSTWKHPIRFSIDLINRWRRDRDWLKRCGMALLGAAFMVCAYPTYNLWPLAWVTWIPVLYAGGVGRMDERRLTGRQTFFIGWLYGAAFHFVGFIWLIYTMDVFGGIPKIAAYAVLALFSAYGGIMTGLLLALWANAWPNGPISAARLLWLAALEPVIEWLYWMLFPWHLANSQQSFPPAIQLAEIAGPYGIGFVLMTANLALYRVILVWRSAQKVRTRHWAAPAIVVIFTFVYGWVRIDQMDRQMEAAPRMDIGLVQGNIGLKEKWRKDGKSNQVETYLNLSQQALQSAAGAGRPLDLIIWPESAVSFVFGGPGRKSSYLTQQMREAVREWDTPLLFGTLGIEGKGDDYSYRNRIYLLEPDGRAIQKYDKMMLLAFGEYIPLINPKWLKKYVRNVGNFTPGEMANVIEVGPAKIAPLICYEALFPAFNRQFSIFGANLLVTVTNDMWFGDTAGPWQHWSLTQMRAVESRAPLVRVANTGVTGVVDSAGRTQIEGPLFEPWQTTVSVRLGTGSSLYSRIGDLPVFLMTLWTFIGWILLWRKRKMDRSTALFEGESRK